MNANENNNEEEPPIISGTYTAIDLEQVEQCYNRSRTGIVHLT